jgi:hypothetical protein
MSLGDEEFEGFEDKRYRSDSFQQLGGSQDCNLQFV